jgi:hypothetical protein
MRYNRIKIRREILRNEITVCGFDFRAGMKDHVFIRTSSLSNPQSAIFKSVLDVHTIVNRADKINIRAITSTTRITSPLDRYFDS